MMNLSWNKIKDNRCQQHKPAKNSKKLRKSRIFGANNQGGCRYHPDGYFSIINYIGTPGLSQYFPGLFWCKKHQKTNTDKENSK